MFRYLPIPSSACISGLILIAASLLSVTVVACSVTPGVATAPAPVPVVAQAESSPTPIALATPIPAVTPVPLATVTPAGASSKVGGLGDPSKRVVLGYYVPYDATSWASFQAQAAGLDYVGAQWVSVDACGNVGSRDDRTLVAYANERGVKVLPSLLTSTGWLNHRLLSDPATNDHFLSEIVKYVVEAGYPGIDLDLEGINESDRDAYSTFIAKVGDALHQRGKILTLAIPAKASD